MWRAGYSFCGGLSWICPQEEVAAVIFCKKERRPTGKISRLLKVKCLEVGLLNSFVDFQDSLAFKSAGSAWTQHFCQSWGRWALQCSLPCFASPDLCPSCTFRWEHVCGPFYMPRQEGARDLNVLWSQYPRDKIVQDTSGCAIPSSAIQPETCTAELIMAFTLHQGEPMTARHFSEVMVCLFVLLHKYLGM